MTTINTTIATEQEACEQIFCDVSNPFTIIIYGTTYLIPSEKALEAAGVLFAYYNADMGEMGNIADAMYDLTINN